MNAEYEKAIRLVNNDEARFVAVLGNGEKILSSDGGIAFLYSLAAKEGALSGAFVADRIVGAAAAFLAIKAGVRELYARVMSARAGKLLSAHGVSFTFSVMTDAVRNRADSDECPMEKAVAGISDPERAYIAIGAALEALKTRKNAP